MPVPALTVAVSAAFAIVRVGVLTRKHSVVVFV
jgi:hypothetical protein